jgi:hypothetical protein
MEWAERRDMDIPDMDVDVDVDVEVDVDADADADLSVLMAYEIAIADALAVAVRLEVAETGPRFTGHATRTVKHVVMTDFGADSLGRALLDAVEAIRVTRRSH